MREARGASPGRRDRRHSARRWLPVLLVLALLAAGVASYRFELGERDRHGDRSTARRGVELPAWSPPGPPSPLGTEPLIAPRRLERLLARRLADPRLGRRVAAAIGDLDAGAPTWTYGEDTYLPASTTKLLTAAAALQAMGPERRFVTRVTTGRSPREVVLVGGGDPLLASTPPTSQDAGEVWPARADVQTLARQTADALGPGRVRVRYDDTLFTGPAENPYWRADYVPDDVVSPVTALMVDAGREARDDFRRADDPSLAAARSFARELAAAGVTVVGDPRPRVVPAGATDLAAVESAPLSDVVEHLLSVSDNEASEVVARHVGLAVSGEGSFVGGTAGVLATLGGLGVPTEGARLYDGSGLSRQNRLTTSLVLGVLRAAAGPDGERLRSVVTGMPVAGFTGSLGERFDEGPALARGLVRAKTGTLSGVSALAGIVTGRDGTVLVFVLGADRVREDGEDEAQEAIDRIAARLATCRCSGAPG